MKLLYFTVLLQISLFSASSLAQEGGNNTELQVQQTLPGWLLSPCPSHRYLHPLGRMKIVG